MIGGPRLISYDRLLRRRRWDRGLLAFPFVISSNGAEKLADAKVHTLTKRLKTGGAKPGALCDINKILNNLDRNSAKQ
jgi:hypothetical protein